MFFYLYILKKQLTNRVINSVLLVIFNIKMDFICISVNEIEVLVWILIMSCY
jgi:hypothetical protein